MKVFIPILVPAPPNSAPATLHTELLYRIAIERHPGKFFESNDTVHARLNHSATRGVLDLDELERLRAG